MILSCFNAKVITCNSYRLFPKKVELQALMKYYDTDGDGNVSYEEFMRGLRYGYFANSNRINYREELTDRRKRMVEKAFTMLDRNGSGEITISDIGMLG